MPQATTYAPMMSNFQSEAGKRDRLDRTYPSVETSQHLAGDRVRRAPVSSYFRTDSCGKDRVPECWSRWRTSVSMKTPATTRRNGDAFTMDTPYRWGQGSVPALARVHPMGA